MRMHLTAAAVFLGLGGVIAQAPGLERLYRWLPAPGPNTLTVVGDVNGDGRADVVQGTNRSTGDVWLCDAEARFQRQPQAMPYFAEVARALVLADFDGDGDLDVAMVNEVPAYSSPTARLRVLHNDGSGRFTANVPGIQLASPTTVLAAGDIDADGDQDIVVGPGRAVWLNGGTGTLQPSSIALSPLWAMDSTHAVTLADLDGDGDADTYVSNDYVVGGTLPSFFPSRDRVWRNDGQGVLTEVAPPAVVVGNTTLDTRAHDFDLDGDVDLLQLTRAGNTHACRLLRNDGALAFTQVWSQVVAAGARIEIAEWDGDGRADLAIHTAAGLTPLVQSAPLQFVPAGLPVQAVALPVLLDVDQDLDTDYIALSTDGYTEYRLVRNVGSGWAPAPMPPPTALPQAWGHDMADVNGDGALDLVWGPSSISTGRILLGDGNGVFTPAAAGDFGQFYAYNPDVECADIDGDGDVDILVGTYQEPVPNPPTSRLFRNVNGTFVAVPFPSVYGQVARLRDLDGDADLDAVLVGYGVITVATNDGTGAFQVVTGSVPFNAYDPRFVHLADFDGDVDLDLLVEYGSYPASTQLFRNVGNATFQSQATTLPPGLECAADLDGDGDVDLLGGAVMYRNNGTGTFIAQPFPALSGFVIGSPLRRILPEDLDQDGRVDLVVVDSSGSGQGQLQSVILWNQGGLAFTTIPFFDKPYWGFPIGFFDVDNDGDRDLLLAGPQPTFLHSIHRHLAPRTLPRIGFSLDIEVRGRVAEPFILGLALARTWLPIAGFGMLQLDPASLSVVALGAFDGAGQATFSVAIPNAPWLVGFAVHWQALSGASPRLGNLLTTVLQAR